MQEQTFQDGVNLALEVVNGYGEEHRGFLSVTSSLSDKINDTVRSVVEARALAQSIEEGTQATLPLEGSVIGGESIPAGETAPAESTEAPVSEPVPAEAAPVEPSVVTEEPVPA